MNVPIDENEEQVQYVMNTLTGAWCRFTNWNANCFEIYDESLFFGDNNGTVLLAYTGRSDVATPIELDMKTAFNYYDDPGRMKVMQMCKPYIVAGGNISPTLGVDVDFGDNNFNALTSTYQEFGALWDEGVWDTAEWFDGAEGDLFNDWQTIGAIGTAISLRLKLNLLPSTISSDSDESSVFDVGLFDQAVFDVGGVFTASGEDLPVLRFNSFQVILEHGNAVG